MSSALTPEQKRRIEENRRKALELRAAKFKQPAPPAQNAALKPQSFYQASAKANAATSSTPSSSQKPYFNSNACRSPQQNKKDFHSRQRQALSSGVSNDMKSLNLAKDTGKVVTGSLTLISKDRFELIMDYHQRTIDAVKNIQGREYDPKKRHWNFPLNQYDNVVAVLKGLRPSVIVGELPKLVLDTFLRYETNTSTSEIDLSRIQSSMRSTLLDFQVEGVKYAVSRGGRVLIADDMGLGKTIQALAIADYYRNDWPLLIVCPSSMRYQWVEEIQKHLINVDSDSIFVITNGKDYFGDYSKVIIISYDLLTSFKDKLLAKKFGVVIMDESHHLKNPKAQRTKSGTELLTRCKRCVLLSGTPVLSRPVELHCQLQGVKPQVFNKFMDFAVRYCNARQERYGWDFSGSSNMEELGILLKELMMVRRLKSEVLAQLPPKRREVVVLESRGKKLSDTSELAKILETEGLKGMEKRSTLLSYFHETGVAKIKGISQYVKDMIDNGEKFLVFAHHAKVLEAICHAVEEKNTDYIRIDGSVSSEDRKLLCSHFQEQDRCLVAVLSIKAANTGLTFTAARLVIFAELYWNPGDLIQAEDRAHRIGQADSVLVQYLVQNGTADDQIWPLVQGKLDLLHKAGLSKDNFRNADTLNVKISQSQEKKDITDYFLTDDDQALAEIDLCNLENNLEVPVKKRKVE